MSAIGSTALHLRIAEFKFTHNFIICDQFPETELIFGINIQRKFSLSYTWDKERNCYIQRDGKFLVYMHTCDCKATIGTVKSTLRISTLTHWCHTKLRQVDLSLRNIWHTSSEMTILQRERNPNINIISSIHKIKDKTSVNVLVSNYTNKHLMFKKAEYVRHLKPAVHG